MEKQKKYKLLFATLCITVLLLILSMHIFYNLQYELRAPSEGWGRHITVGGVLPYKKKPSIHITNDKAEVLNTDGKNFINFIIDRKTARYKKETIVVENAELNKIVKLEWNKDFIFWMENFTLYYSKQEANGEYSPKVKLLEEVNDFKILNKEGVCNIIAVNKTGIFLYEATRSEIVQIGMKYELADAEGVSMVYDNSGVLHVAAFADENVLFPIKYLTFENGKWNVISQITEKQYSTPISDIEIGIDDADVYIFYTTKTWSSVGVTSRIYFTSNPIANGESKLDFRELRLFNEDKYNSRLYLSSLECVKNQGEVLSIALIKDTYDIIEEDAYAVYALELDNGVISDMTKVTLEKPWIPFIDIKKIDNSLCIALLDVAGGFKYQILYTENGNDFVQSVNRIKAIDIFYAILNVLPGYINGFFYAMLRSFTFLPAVLWILIIEVFDIKKLKRKMSLTLGIAIIIHIIMKLFTTGFYYTTLTVMKMPQILVFPSAKFIYALSIAFIAYLLTKIYKRINSEISYIVEYFIFAFLDIIISMLLYTTYMI